MNEPWQPAEPPTDEEPLVEIDPRVDSTHVVGTLPCPKNPPPPEGWAYWSGALPKGGGALATEILRDAERYPMGAFVQALLAGQLVGARVEWHDLQGATGKRGCFRGVNLMRFLGIPVPVESPEPPSPEV